MSNLTPARLPLVNSTPRKMSHLRSGNYDAGSTLVGPDKRELKGELHARLIGLHNNHLNCDWACGLLSPSASHLRRTDFTPAAEIAFAVIAARKSEGGKNEQVNRCRFCPDPGNVRASHVALTTTSAGRHDHANP